jgi:DNA-binding transcriptional LysR family regulator
MDATKDLTALRVFASVAEAASFSAAAAKLGLSPSRVSRAVAGLEAALGVQLLHRTTRHVALSTAGAALYERVAPQLAALADAIAALPEREEEPSGELRITAPVDVAALFLSELVTRFTARHPGITVDVHVTNRRVDLVAQGFDVALRAGGSRLEDSSLVARKASSLGMGVFASPAYLARAGVPRSLDDLAAHDWIVFRGHGSTPGVRARGRVLCDDMLFAREAARAGGGMAWLPLFMAAPYVAAGGLTRVLPRLASRPGSLWIVHPAAKHVPRKVTAFRDLVLESLRAHPLAA